MSSFLGFSESNRWKHFLCAIPVGFLFTVLAALGAAGGMEFKDSQRGGRWDWLDFLWTVLGGAVGNALQALFIWLFIR